jgi:hypothetical protein
VKLKEELDGNVSETALDKLEGNSDSSLEHEGEGSPSRTKSDAVADRKDDGEATSGPSVTGKAFPSNSADQRDMTRAQYLQLQCFYEFVEKQLRNEIELRERVTMGTLKIRFQDLWHLYQMGDMVYSQSHSRDQLYKVFAITGGEIPKRKLEHREIIPTILHADYEETVDLHEEVLEKEQYSGTGVWSTLKIDCYKMAFDGVHCGPVDVLKRIRPYTGERDITSLPVFPVQFHPERDLMMRKVEERGKKLLFEGGHKSYNGSNVALELEDRRERIGSDVYIDFDTYFQDFPIRKPHFGRFFRSKQNPAEVEEVWPGMTYNRFLSGHEVDAKRYEDFMATNRTSLERFKPDESSISLEHLALLPPWVFGYIFQTRRWSE